MCNSKILSQQSLIAKYSPKKLTKIISDRLPNSPPRKILFIDSWFNTYLLIMDFLVLINVAILNITTSLFHPSNTNSNRYKQCFKLINIILVLSFSLSYALT